MLPARKTMIPTRLVERRLRRAVIDHINRFLIDLERRYPGSTGSGPVKSGPEHP
jgi:hypothetical protein